MNRIERGAVLSALRERAPRSLHLAELASRLGVPKKRRDEVLDVLDQLVEDGAAIEMPGLRFRARKRAEA
ncbi:MAG: hypothetical protein KC543_10500, partial [Myxococcales bacterium]|nr:hypothetical protein [Myxococcales bacterium]